MLRLTLLDRIAFFDDFDDEEKEYILSVDSLFSRIAVGEYIIRQGSHDSNLFILIKGDLLVSRDNKPLAELKAGAVFGEMSFLTREVRSTDVKATTPATVFSLSSDSFSQFSLGLQTKVQAKIIHTLVNRITDMNATLANLLR